LFISKSLKITNVIFLPKMQIQTIVAEVAIWLTPQVPSPL